MKNWRSLAVSLTLILPSIAGANVGQFNGYRSTNQTIYDRAIQAGAEFDIGSYLIDHIKTNFEDIGLLDLLGVYVGDGLNVGFRNGTPNGVGMLLWNTSLTALAQDVGKLCADPKAIPQGDTLRSALKPLCTWPSADARAEGVLFSFWVQWMNFDAPYSEYEVWRDFFLSDDYAQAPASEVVAAMTRAILLNPYFLLQK